MLCLMFYNLNFLGLFKSIWLAHQFLMDVSGGIVTYQLSTLKRESLLYITPECHRMCFFELV